MPKVTVTAEGRYPVSLNVFCYSLQSVFWFS